MLIFHFSAEGFARFRYHLQKNFSPFTDFSCTIQTIAQPQDNAEWIHCHSKKQQVPKFRSNTPSSYRALKKLAKTYRYGTISLLSGIVLKINIRLNMLDLIRHGLG